MRYNQSMAATILLIWVPSAAVLIFGALAMKIMSGRKAMQLAPFVFFPLSLITILLFQFLGCVLPVGIYQIYGFKPGLTPQFWNDWDYVQNVKDIAAIGFLMLLWIRRKSLYRRDEPGARIINS